MENQNQRKEWNKRWEAQMLVWQREREQLVFETELLRQRADELMALNWLAHAQIKRDPPE